MSELVAASFADKFKAEEVLISLLKLQQTHLASLEDAVIAVKNAEGRLRVKAYHDLVEPAPELGNELWGGIISGVVFHRALGIGGIVDSTFLTELEDSLAPNSSLLFVLAPSTELESVAAELAKAGGKILRTPLPESTQETLQDAVKTIA